MRKPPGLEKPQASNDHGCPNGGRYASGLCRVARSQSGLASLAFHFNSELSGSFRERRKCMPFPLAFKSAMQASASALQV